MPEKRILFPKSTNYFTLPSKWPDIFGSPTIANAILDRLLHHSHIISIKGPSYRIQSKIQYLDNNRVKDSGVS
ncbi:ATP-binding protein [Schnuerera ultunensis]|uniref:ATP-binding protein n=1 Tax=Schnuerera ultunensis TaxID=45497 RepID=UPI0003F7FC5A|nr:ATP-binding protein [Schnuerera ultunensis]